MNTIMVLYSSAYSLFIQVLEYSHIHFLIEQEVTWKREWFSHLPKFSKLHWESMSNRRDFLNQLANQYNIRSEHDWSRITNSLIKIHGGAVITLYLSHFEGITSSIQQLIGNRFDSYFSRFKFETFSQVQRFNGKRNHFHDFDQIIGIR